MSEISSDPNPMSINIPGPDSVRIEQRSTRGDGSVVLGENFNIDSLDFSAAIDHLSIHTDGEIAGSQFDGERFAGPDDIIAMVTSSLPDTLQYDQHDMVEITIQTEGVMVGFTGVKSIEELHSMEGVTIELGMRIPGGEIGEVDGVKGAWYPEVARDAETGKFEVVKNPDGSIKNPHGKFEPEAYIAKVEGAELSRVLATDKVTAIIRKNPDTGAPTLLTVYPGEIAPAFPAKIASEHFQLDTLHGGQEAGYWSEHAFIQS